MKPIKHIFIFIALILASSSALVAQNKANKGTSREVLDALIQKELEAVLELQGEKLESFKKIYQAYKAELREVKSPFIKYKHLKDLSNEEIDKKIKESFKNAEKIAAIKEKYYNQFKTILTPQEILKMYRAEKEIKAKLKQKLHERKTNHKQHNKN